MPSIENDQPTGTFRTLADAARAPLGSSGKWDVEMAGLSNVGLVRKNNEDHYLVARLDRTWRTIGSNLPPDAVPDLSMETAYGLLVADGMGGRAAGEVASRLAIATLVDLLLQTPDLILRLNPDITEEALHRLDQRFHRIKDVLAEQVVKNPSLAGMGTTMTMAASIGPDLLIAHVGDSRAYLFRRGELRRLTRDQTMAQFLADTGVITEDQIATHPLRHVLTNVLGTQGSAMAVDLSGLRLEEGDLVLLCSDGLTEMVNDATIASTLGDPAAASEQLCQRLIDRALEAGGKDNVTAVIGRYRRAPAKN